MAKIVDPDQLNQGTEVTINTSTKTIRLNPSGNLDDGTPAKTSGVTMQALYSFLKEEWKDDASLNRFKFPIKAFTKFEFQWQNSWAPDDALTRRMLRDAGWIESVGAENGDQYAGVISLGDMNDSTTDRGYYQQLVGFDQGTFNFGHTGEINEAILINDASASPTGDFTDFLKIYLREQGKTYAGTNLLVDQDLSLLEPTVYRVPLSNDVDIKITAADATIDTTTPYTGMTVSYLEGVGFATFNDNTVYPSGTVVFDSTFRWFFSPAGGTSSTAGSYDTASDVGITDWEAYTGERLIGTGYWAYNRIINGFNGDAEEIYEWSQRQLRKNTDINSALEGGAPLNQDGFGTVNGNIAPVLLGFQGDTLQTQGGVYIDNFDVNDQNRIQFFDVTLDGGGVDSESVPVTTTARTFPFVAAGNITFSSNLTDEPDADTLYRMYFRYTETAINVTDISISGASGSSATITSSTTDLDNVDTGEYFTLAGFSNSVNNGLWIATSNFSATGGTADKVDGDTVINEGAGPTVTFELNPFDSPGAIVVDNNAGTDISGQISASSIAFDFDYDNNTQGGRTAGTDAPVTIVAQGLNGAEWVSADFTITRNTGLTFAVSANDERNYSNP